MRVLIVTESFLPSVNGVTNSVLRVIEHLERRGHEALVVAAGPGPDHHGDTPVLRVPSVRPPMYRSLAIGLPTTAVRRAMEAFEPDVVHLAAPTVLGATGAVVAKRLGIPSVAVYQTDLAGFARRYRVGALSPAIWRWLRWVHQHADLTLAPSTLAAWSLASHGIAPVERWARGVDTVRFSPAHRNDLLRRRVGVGEPLLVGYVGRLAAEKQVDRLRHAAAVPGCRVVVVGDGPTRSSLERLLPDAVFLGFLDGPNLSQAVASLDVFVHTGDDETFCQSVQEALAAGVPVVAPASGGPLDLVRHGVTGFLYPSHEPELLGQAVAQLAADPRLRAAMGAAARRSVQGRSWEEVGDELLDHYRVVTNRSTKARRAA